MAYRNIFSACYDIFSSWYLKLVPFDSSRSTDSNGSNFTLLWVVYSTVISVIKSQKYPKFNQLFFWENKYFFKIFLCIVKFGTYILLAFSFYRPVTYQSKDMGVRVPANSQKYSNFNQLLFSEKEYFLGTFFMNHVERNTNFTGLLFLWTHD